MLRPPVRPQAQIILGKYHKREDFRTEVRLLPFSTDGGKEAYFQPGAAERRLEDTSRRGRAGRDAAFRGGGAARIPKLAHHLHYSSRRQQIQKYCPTFEKKS